MNAKTRMKFTFFLTALLLAAVQAPLDGADSPTTDRNADHEKLVAETHKAALELREEALGFSQVDRIHITPQSDTYTESGPHANLSYGDLDSVLVNGADANGIERQGFLTFMFTGQTLGYKSFSDATLELYMSSATTAHTLDVYGVNHAVTADEHTLTWKTTPNLTKECTLLGSCAVKPGDTSVVITSEKLLELVKGASPRSRSVSFVLVGRTNNANWDDPPFQFFSKEYGVKEKEHGPYLSFGPKSPCLLLTPAVTWNPTSVNNPAQPPVVTINGRDNGYYKIQYKEKTSNDWKTAQITATEAGRLYLEGVLTDKTGYAKVNCAQLANIQADIKLEEVPFYTVSAASDPTFATLLATKGTGNGQYQRLSGSSTHPLYGSNVEVNHLLLEKGLGTVSDPRLVTKSLCSGGGQNSEDGLTSFFTRWYQVDGNTQVFRHLDNEGTVYDPRVEATTGEIYDLVKQNIVCFEATYFLPRGSASTILQLSVHKNKIPELGIAYPFTALHAGNDGYSISHTRYTKVQAWRGEKQNNFLHDAYATNVTIRFRIDGTYYEYSLRKPDGTYKVIDGGYLPVPLINGKKLIGFRWGMYPGHGGPETSHYGFLFVTGANVTFEPNGRIERPAWAHNY